MHCHQGTCQRNVSSLGAVLHQTRWPAAHQEHKIGLDRCETSALHVPACHLSHHLLFCLVTWSGYPQRSQMLPALGVWQFYPIYSTSRAEDPFRPCAAHTMCLAESTIGRTMHRRYSHAPEDQRVSRRANRFHPDLRM